MSCAQGSACARVGAREAHVHIAPRYKARTTENTQLMCARCLAHLYCNEFAGSISRWKFITLKIQYTTVNYNQ
jgi:hypothetical protein